MLSFPRLVVLATVTAGAVIVSGVGVIGYQSYAAVQVEARGELEVATTSVDKQLASFDTDKSAVEVALAEANGVLADSAGKTLDETARTALTAAVATAQDALSTQTQRIVTLQDSLSAATADFESELAWPPTALQTVHRFTQTTGAGGPTLADATTLIEKRIKAVQAAQTAWQAEQDRLAAVAAAEAEAAAEKAAQEAAARLAAPRTITATSTVTDSGGGTAPSAPAAPSTPIAPVVGFSVEAYVAALAPNSYISWVDGLCAGYYACGRAWVGGVQSTPVKIELDPALRDIYANSVGISVLVHESAHARQWLYYGGDIISANVALTGGFLPSDTRQTGAPSVEYMADCATIVKLGYSTGTYTSTCTPDQLAAAALIW